ncbi:hypothetical protein ON010_g13495 [Phytophthora cinnamomi]|nr:hypothetical protein ON010_g13495 [Phytophthora cinnamomi]
MGTHIPGETTSQAIEPEEKPKLTADATIQNPDVAPGRRTSSTASTAGGQVRHPSIRKTTTQRGARRLLRQYHDWMTKHMYLGRYSIEKMLAFEEYQQIASPARVIAVIAPTPLPGLLIMILLAAIPLQNPQHGLRGNPC